MSDADAEPLAARGRSSAVGVGCARTRSGAADSTPSVPPDMTKAILSSTARGASSRCGDSASHNAATAYSRVKSLTPPLPSVLPSTARIVAGSILPVSISAMRPERRPALWSECG